MHAEMVLVSSASIWFSCSCQAMDELGDVRPADTAIVPVAIFSISLIQHYGKRVFLAGGWLAAVACMAADAQYAAMISLIVGNGGSARMP
ncbi:hypothetical protein C2845_PM04G02090 [Panicum miliaceum]|uniref:Uncharacterized protein n=1 Tax=Panicum miliaceum TaxID=4540 RepID=A0A3L6QTQ2_PANMI|nr:hypothetical protein C2845_PM04G02090 [Panicum miliaceum]